MSHAACIGADLYSLLVRHPWRPRGFVVGNGAEGYVNVSSVDGEIVRYASASLVGLRALAVNQRLMTWGSEETTVGVGVGGSVGVVRVGGETGVLHAATNVEDPQYMCSALQWNPDVGSQLAATFQPQSSGVRPLHKCVKVYDLSGGTTLSPHAELSSECAYALCWLSHSSLLASTAEGLLVCDTRQREQQAGSADTTPLYHLSRNPADPHTVAGIRVGPHGYAIELHDTRHLEKGAVACAPSAHSIGTLAWHSTSGCLVTTVVGGSVVETWDSSQLAKEIDTARDVGYESDYDCSRATAGVDKEGPLGDRIGSGSGSGSGVGGGPRPMKRACSGLRGHEEKRVGQAVLGSAWAGSAEEDRRLVLLTADGCDVVELCESEQRVGIGVAACGVVVQGANGAAPAVLHAPDYSDVATAMRMREEQGLGTSRYNTLRVAEACDDVPLQQWAWWTWLMRRAEEHTRTKGGGKSVSCPSVLSMARMEGELDTRLLAATDQERKQRQHDKEAGGAGLSRVAGGREGAEKVACKGHHAVLERQFKVYDSEWRRFLQQLCGWSEAADMPEDVVPVMQGGRGGDDADDDAGFEQSVANQILHLRLTAAEDVLRHAGGRNKPTYSLMAFALSSLTTDSSVAWRETVGSLQDAGLHPHLTAALRFLSCWSEADADEEGGRYSTVLDCPSIDVLYRIGFAARYLSDTALVQYVTKVSQARLHPLTKLLLDGVSEASLAAFLDHTGDVQVTALTAVMFLPYNAESTQRWVRSYREFLTWGGAEFARCRAELVLSNLRTESASSKTQAPAVQPFGGLRSGLDAKKMLRLQRQVAMMKQVKGATSQPHKEDKKVAPTLQAVCKVCGASLSLSAMKPAVCLKCSTPLPKCSVCVKTLGIGVEDAFSHQITWCLSCCHGGHVSHLVDWFETHETCPVAGCDCTCATLD